MCTLRRSLAFGLVLAPLAAAAQPPYESTVVPEAPGEVPEERAQSRVDREEIERRQARSSPDALRWEPGVFVQQTAHGQGSAYLRGLTGQQTLLIFDGIRLNNSTYRQGPNQYLFTIDSRTLAAITVLRGGGSTRFGSDALGGAIEALPIAPALPAGPGFTWEPRLLVRGATADGEIGGRAQIMLAAATRRGIKAGFLGGVGLRRAGLLESSGPVENPDPTTPLGRLPWVPRFAPDGRTQLGTGFRELTADGRLVVRFDERHSLTVAAYLYRQHDVPRTDQCPPPTAPYDTCLTYDEQFRHLVYAAWEARLHRFARRLRVTLSWQEQHERRRLDQPGQFTQNRGVDDVHTLGLTARAQTALFRPAPRLGLRVDYGLDSYLDFLRSSAEIYYSDVDRRSPQSRGQYLDGSRYLSGGAFGDLALYLPRLVLRAGARLGWVHARAPGDAQSGTRAIDRGWATWAAHAGLEVRVVGPLLFLVNVDHSFRAPNLDDLTSRQQTGPGFQFENAELRPEQATTFEAGLRLHSQRWHLDLWVFETLLHDAILREPRSAADCPAGTPACQSAWSLFQLANAPALSELRGVEGALRVHLPGGLSARLTLSYAWGEGPRIGAVPLGLDVQVGERVPLSRVPPLNGTVEVWWSHRIGLVLSAGLRWAAAQHRLALADYADGRIPRYGTPGFVVVDLRAAWQITRRLRAILVVDNVFDSPYRYHGSSVNGPARGALLSLEATLH